MVNEILHTKRNLRVWLYYRLSRDEDVELNSLNNQRGILVDFVDSKGYDIVGESFNDNVSGMLLKERAYINFAKLWIRVLLMP